MRRFEQQVKQVQPQIQLVLPITELCAQLQPGLLHLLKSVGVQCLEQMMEWEVGQVVGEAHKTNQGRTAYRWGTEEGYCSVAGQKVPLTRPRVRDTRQREIQLGSYALIQQGSLREEAVWNKVMHGLTTRRYSEVVREFQEAYGIEKSTVSRQFVHASRAAWRKLENRRFDHLPLCAVLIDGKQFQRHQMIAALGVTVGGQKTVLGICHGATENADVVRQLLEQLQDRGLDFHVPRLYVLDGSKALAKAIVQLAGPAAVIQRCQQHKRENVLSYLTEQDQPFARLRLNAAYATLDHANALRALQDLVHHLERVNHSAARSLTEGMEQVITLHRLRVPGALRRSLSTTNLIESAFASVESICHNVKRWRPGDQRLRWLASALVFCESRWNRLHGFRQIPLLIKELEVDVLRSSVPKYRAGIA